jgi:hypothetical protein
MARAIQGLTTTQSESQLTWCPWHSPHHRRRGYGDGGGNGEDQGAPAMRYSAIGAARRMAVVGPNPPYAIPQQSEVHMRIVQKSTCITNATQLWHRRAGGAFDSLNGCSGAAAPGRCRSTGSCVR